MEEMIVKQTEKMRRGKAKSAIVGCALAAALAVGGAMAYLTDTETVTNKLSLDTNFDITLTEPAWVTTDADANGIPDAAENMAPMQEIAKDPTITNVGTVDGWMAMTMKMPVFSGKIIGDDGKAVAVTDHDLYNFTVNSGWTQVGTPTVADGYRTYTYVYDNQLAKDGTATLFDKVQVVNLAEGIATTANQIELTAHGIQAEGFADASSAYSAYVDQNAAGMSVDGD